MSYTVIVTQRAYLQLSTALEWYLKNATGHEKKLLKTFDKSIISIAKIL